MQKNITYTDKLLITDIISWKYSNPIWNSTFFQTKWAEKRKNNWQRDSSKLKIVTTIWNHIFRKEI
jgi:hypothetical protein